MLWTDAVLFYPTLSYLPYFELDIESLVKGLTIKRCKSVPITVAARMTKSQKLYYILNHANFSCNQNDEVNENYY